MREELGTVLYDSKGVLRYVSTNSPSYKLIVEIDSGITTFYRSLIPKTIRFNSLRHEPHVSVVRKEEPPNLDAWGKYEGQEVEFKYSPYVYIGETYIWLNVYCRQLEEIRLELGLPVSSPYSRPPAGWDRVFHTTIANRKGL